MRRHGMNLRKWVMKSFMMPCLRRLPTNRSFLLSERIGRVESSLLPGYRKDLRRVVSEANRHFGTDWDIAETARQLAGRLTRWRTRDILLDNLDRESALASFVVTGREHLDQALAQGKGVVLLSNHFGSHMLPAHWMLRSGVEFRFLTERPRHISKLLAKYFQSEGPTGQKELFISRKKAGNQGVSSLIRSIRCLKANHVLLVACDVRWDDNQSVVGRFMGIHWKFTPIWAILSMRSGAPVVPVFCSMMPDGRHHLEFLPPESIPADANLTELVQASLERVEARVKTDPGNSNDYFFWKFDRSELSASMRVDLQDSTLTDSKNAPNTPPPPHFHQTVDAHKKANV